MTSTIKQPMASIIFKDYSYAYSVGGGSSLTISATQLGLSSPSGYHPLSVVTVESGHVAVCFERISAYLDQRIRNTSSSTQNGTYTMRVAYIKV